MQNLIDEISELVYVVDIKDYQLLYINDTGRELFQLEKNTKKKCYEALYHRQKPCEFCTNDKINMDTFFTWECYNSVTQRHYLLKDKKILWEGQEAKLEIALDITHQIRQRQSLQISLEIEGILLDCVKILYQTDEIANAIIYMLEKLGIFFHSSHSYLFQIEKLYEMQNGGTYEWTSEKITIHAKEKRKILLPFLFRCLENLKLADIIPFYDIWDIDYKKLQSFPQIYNFFQQQEIRQMIAAPLSLNGKLFGFIIIENPSFDKRDRVGALLRTLGYFFSSSIERVQTKQILEKYSFEDGMTGLYNRNRFMIDLDKITSEKKKRVGIIFLDVNGLKMINDNLGHSFGDKILIHTAQILKRVLKNDMVYRIGGDEFVIICCEIEKEVFKEKVKKLEKILQEEKCNISIGFTWRETVKDINLLMTEADAQMYEDKKKYYTTYKKEE